MPKLKNIICVTIVFFFVCMCVWFFWMREGTGYKMHTKTKKKVMPGQWEYQIGPCGGLEASDDLWLSRYLLERSLKKKIFF